MPEQPKSLAIPPHFPQPLTPFVGRRQELSDIAQTLADPACRLLTMVGPGGIGKTRLAVQAAAQFQENFQDGLHFVSLQAIESSDLLISAIADSLNVHLAGPQALYRQLFFYLQDKNLLLVLDNFEHLMPAAALLPELLHAAPAVKLLVTSREALNLPEESLFAVSGMPYPAPDAPDLQTYSAVQLFVDRASRVRPDFPAEDEHEIIARICRLVEGTPLAIELAASWLKTLSCAGIAAEIERNLDFLTSRWRTVAGKHRSVRAVFNQSWSLLDETEQTVFKRLGVFRGGFRRQAAERIAGASLVSLSALIDKSLLRWERDGRYQIHELLRQYAAEQLAQSPEDVAHVYDAHCSYYAGFLHERAGSVMGGRQRETLLEIEAELDNIRAAWQWAVAQVKVDEIRQAAEALYVFYDFRGRYLEGINAFEEARRRLVGDDTNRQQVLALVLLQLGGLYIRLGQLDTAVAVLEECQAIYQALNLPPLPGYGTDPIFLFGIIASIRGDYADAARLGEQAHRASESQGHLPNGQFAYYLLGRAALLQGQHKAAREHIQRAYHLTEETGDLWFRAYCLNELGHIASAQNHDEAAREFYTRSYDIRRAFDDPEGMAVALNNLGNVAWRQEDYTEAQRLYRDSLARAGKINNRGEMATALNGLGRTAMALADYPAARQLFQQALSIVRDGQFVSLAFSLLLGIGELLVELKETGRGVELLALVQQHPGSEYETRQQARKKLERLQAGGFEESAAGASMPWEELESLLAALELELAAPLGSEEHATEEKDRLTEAGPPSGSAALVEPLTERELEVLGLLAEGLSNPEIAGQLILAVGTVKHYTSVIYGKLGVSNRTQAVIRARELNLL